MFVVSYNGGLDSIKLIFVLYVCGVNGIKLIMVGPTNFNLSMLNFFFYVLSNTHYYNSIQYHNKHVIILNTIQSS